MPIAMRFPTTMNPKNTTSKLSLDAKIAAAAPAGGCMIPSLHMAETAKATVSGTRNDDPADMIKFTTKAIDIEMIWPYKAFLGWDAGAGVNPY